MQGESGYTKPEIEKVPNTKEALDELVNKVTDYLESFGPIYPEIQKASSEDKEYLKDLTSLQEVPDKELPFFQSLFEKLLEQDKTRANYLTAIEIKNHLMRDLKFFEKNSDNKKIVQFPDQEEKLNTWIQEQNSKLIKLLGMYDGIERELSNVNQRLISLEKRGLQDSPKVALLRDEQAELVRTGINLQLQKQELESQIEEAKKRLKEITDHGPESS